MCKSFLVVPELKEMLNKLELYIKSAKSRAQRKYYEDTLTNLKKIIIEMEIDNG